jgi:hypothetical protein
MTKRRVQAWWVGLLLVCLAVRGMAQTAPEIQSGLAWLENQITSTGEVLNASSSIATPLQNRAEIIQTLTLLSSVPATGLVDAVGAETDGTTESLARQILAYAQTKRSPTSLLTALLANRNANSGFGSAPGYRSNPLDTALALIALKASGYADSGVLSGALAYLGTAANPDGGYGLPDSPSASQVYVTAYVLSALQTFSQTYAVTAPRAAARQWLVAQQIGGAYGDTVSNAVAAAALIASTTDTTAFSGLVSAIKVAQQGNGSWDADPYVTALALRALYLAGTWTAPPTTGTITGVVLEQGSYNPLAGATIRLLEATGVQATTGTDGRFTLSGVTPGTYTVEASASGYATATVTHVGVTAGNTASLGNITLGLDATAAFLRGTITDGTTGTPVAGATLSLSGAVTTSAVTDASGNYQLAGLPTGTVTITVSASGYDPLTATTALATNTVTLFSPGLYQAGTTPATATLQGQVADASTGQPIGGATVAVAGQMTTTDATGQFTLAGLTAGALSASVSAPEYGSATLSGTLVNGVNDAGLIRLAPLGVSTTAAFLRGTITDGTTGAPVAGATLTLSGAATISAVTDASGNYQLAGLPTGTVTITVSASGYDPLTATTALATNTVTLFSPSLYSAGTTPTTATLQGQVADAATGQPIGGATMTVAGQMATTDATGQFTLAGLTAGALSASVSAPGYGSAILSGTLVNGVNDAGLIRLTLLSASTTTVSGMVSDAATGQPIAGASLRLQDAATPIAITGTDGHYQLTGITAQAFTVSVNAAGYLSQSASGTASPGASVLADFALVRSQPANGLQITSVVTDQPAYDPYSKIKISAAVSNTSSQPIGLIFSATILDNNLSPVAEVPAIQLVLGQSPSDAVQQVPANGTLNVVIDWHNTNLAAGPYSVVVHALNVDGSLAAEDGTAFSINALPRLGGGITLTPPITQVDSHLPIAIGANVLNYGNVPIPAGPAELTVTLTNPDNVPPSTPTASAKTLLSGAPLNSPRGGVFDDAGNYYVVNNYDRRVIQIDASGQPTTLATLPSSLPGLGGISPVDIVRDSTGTLWILNSSQLILKLAPDYKSLTGQKTGLGTQYGFDRDAAGNFYITGYVGAVRGLAKLDLATHTTTLLYSSSGAYGVQMGPDDAVYVAEDLYNNGTVTRYTDNSGPSPYAAGLSNSRQLAFGPSGILYVAGNSGSVMTVTNGVTTDLNVKTLLGSYAFDGIAVDSQGTVMLTRSGRNDINGFSGPAVPVIPPAGTVVYTADLDLVGLPVGADTVAVALGSWTPEFSGDYEVRLRSGQAGVDGALVNYLHVGPHVNAQMSADRTSVAPTQDTVGVNIAVKGADFTSFSKVDTANLMRTVAIGTPMSMGADAAGNLYFANGGEIKKVDPADLDGTVTTFAYNATYIRGQIPVDSAQNLYISDGSSNRLLSLDQQGNSTLVATLPDPIVSLAINARDELFVLTRKQIVKVKVQRNSNQGSQNVQSSQSIVTSAGITSPYSLTIDGQGNLYVQNTDNIINRVAPDGSVSTLPLTGVTFEKEGNNIAGDCAGNLFLTPYYWPQVGQSGEEHTIVQLIGNSGQAASILDGNLINNSVIKYELGDMDFIVYDRFSSNLLIWTDRNSGHIYKLPVTCGAITTELHVVLPAGQSATGLTPTYTRTLVQPDGSTEYVWNLKDVTAQGQTLRFDTVLNNLALGEERFVARDAFLVFQNSFVAGEVRVPIQIPKVKVENRVQLSVTTDQPVYPAATPVLVGVDLTNANAYSVNGQAVVEIYDALGVRVAGVLAEPALIAAHGVLNLAPVFNTGTTQVGSYTVRAALLNDQGAVLALGSTPFQIVAGDGSGATLSGSVTTDKAAYAPYDTVTLTGRVENLAPSLILNDLTLGEIVTNPAGQVIFTASQALPPLVGGSLEDRLFTLPLVAAPPGTYTVTQRVMGVNGLVLDTRTATFTVQSTADTGSGLRGSLTATPTAVQPGDPVTLAVTVGNLGNADLAGLPLIVRLVDPASGTLVQSWQETTDLPQLSRYDGSHVYVSGSLVGGATYVAVLSAQIGGAERVLAQASFKVTEPPIKLNVTTQTTTGRVLALVSCQGDEDDGEDRNSAQTEPPAGGEHAEQTGDEDGHTPACLAARRTLLDRVLTELGLRHLIVSDQEAFRRAFHSGVYDTYWLSGGREKLKGTLAKELREAVYRGDGLLSDGQHDERNAELDAVGGFLYRGKLGTLDLPVAFIDAPFDLQTLASQGRGLKLNLAGGSAAATFPSGTPAVVRNSYGAGRSLAFGFDLPALLAEEASYMTWREVLRQALADLKPATLATQAGGAYALERITVRNLAQAVTGRFLFRLPEGASVADADPALTPTTDGGWLWSFDLPAMETRTLDWGLRLPETEGEYAFTGRLDVERNGAFQPYGDYSWSFTVATAQIETASLRAALMAYHPPQRQDQQVRDRAVKALDQALALAADGLWDDAIAKLLDAGDSIAALPTVDALAWRRQLARLLQDYAWRAYRAETGH